MKTNILRLIVVIENVVYYHALKYKQCCRVVCFYVIELLNLGLNIGHGCVASLCLIEV